MKFYTFVGWKCNVITQVEKVDIWGADEIRVIRGVRVVRGDTLTIDGFDEMDDFQAKNAELRHSQRLKSEAMMLFLW